MKRDLTLAECFAILKLPETASFEEVKAAHRRIVKELHPDQYTNKPRLMQLAEEDLKTVNAAFDFLRRYFSDSASTSETDGRPGNANRDDSGTNNRKHESGPGAGNAESSPRPDTGQSGPEQERKRAEYAREEANRRKSEQDRANEELKRQAERQQQRDREEKGKRRARTAIFCVSASVAVLLILVILSNRSQRPPSVGTVSQPNAPPAAVAPSSSQDSSTFAFGKVAKQRVGTDEWSLTIRNDGKYHQPSQLLVNGLATSLTPDLAGTTFVIRLGDNECTNKTLLSPSDYVGITRTLIKIISSPAPVVKFILKPVENSSIRDTGTCQSVKPLILKTAGLSAPVQVSPSDHSSLQRGWVQFTWLPVSDADSYVVEVDLFGSFRPGFWGVDLGYHSLMMHNQSQYDFTSDKFIRHRWRVWAMDQNGKEGPRSPWWEFQLQ